MHCHKDFRFLCVASGCIYKCEQSLTRSLYLTKVQFLSEVKFVWIQIFFSSSWLVAQQRSSLSKNSPRDWECNGIMPLPMALAPRKPQTDSSRIWTWVNNSISQRFMLCVPSWHYSYISEYIRRKRIQFGNSINNLFWSQRWCSNLYRWKKQLYLINNCFLTDEVKIPLVYWNKLIMELPYWILFVYCIRKSFGSVREFRYIY